MPAIREVHADGWCVRLDLRPQVLGVEVPEFVTAWRRDGQADPLMATPPLAMDGPVSAATLLLKAKQFDDGLYAAVELAAQHGAGLFAGKASLLRSLAGVLAGPPAATIHAACILSGQPVVAPEPIKEVARTLVDNFLRDELASKPLGFYTWTPELSAIFRQDRFLQHPLDPATADALARAIENTSEASSALAACVRLATRLTNPLAGPGLRDGRGPRAFLPASRSHEQVLVERLFGNRPIPEGFDLMSELIRRVRSGEVSLEPISDSGWYDHQTWSLEPLVVPDGMPEAGRLELGERYRKHLEDLFRGALALARETHVKQLAIAMAGGCGSPLQRPILVRPGLSVEPLPEVYSRRAASYRFVRGVLEEAFGKEALAGLHRLTQEGLVALGLADELAMMEKMFDGATATARRELGMEPLPGDEEAAGQFMNWKANLAADRDVGRDCRMMVPVFFDLRRRKTKVWAFLGWQTVPVDVDYRVTPEVLEILPAMPPEPTDRFSVLRRMFRRRPRPGPAGPPPVEFRGERYEFAVPVMAEVYVTRLLDRDEFRGHCDRHKTRDAILANLE